MAQSTAPGATAGAPPPTGGARGDAPPTPPDAHGRVRDRTDRSLQPAPGRHDHDHGRRASELPARRHAQSAQPARAEGAHPRGGTTGNGAAPASPAGAPDLALNPLSGENAANAA